MLAWVILVWENSAKAPVRKTDKSATGKDSQKHLLHAKKAGWDSFTSRRLGGKWLPGLPDKAARVLSG
jgi:hypothetical protein